jgi:hypothetical protein
MCYRRCTFLVILVVAALFSTAYALPVSISAKVNGMDMQIGTLDAMEDARGAGAFGEFRFATGKEFLDDWYDFRWINIETGYTLDGTSQARDPITGKLPAIDPQPGQNIPGIGAGDNIPYYYNQATWASGMFGPDDIRNEGEFSRFFDFPGDGNNDSLIDFMTFLVVDSVTDQLIADNTFCVIGWFDWIFDNKDAGGNRDVSIRTVSSVVTSAFVDLINMALANADDGDPVGDPVDFPGWSARKDCDLRACVPEIDAGTGTSAWIFLSILLTLQRERQRRPSPCRMR